MTDKYINLVKIIDLISDGQMPVYLSDDYKKMIPDENILMMNYAINCLNFNNENFLNLSIHELLKSEICKIENRQDVEYFYPQEIEYRQVVVCAFIHDSEKVLFLKINNSNNFKRGTISMVQGHATITYSDLSISLREYLINNILREVEEEVLLNDKPINYNAMSDCITNITSFQLYDNSISRKHKSILFTIKVDSVDGFSSREPQKHSVVVMDKFDICDNYDMLDSWTLCAIKENSNFFNNLFAH